MQHCTVALELRLRLQHRGEVRVLQYWSSDRYVNHVMLCMNPRISRDIMEDRFQPRGYLDCDPTTPSSQAFLFLSILLNCALAWCELDLRAFQDGSGGRP